MCMCIHVIFWVMILCSDIVVYECFRGLCCFHLQSVFLYMDNKKLVYGIYVYVNSYLPYILIL